MNTIPFPNAGHSVPNFERLANAIKTIKRSVPSVQDGAYTYFADTLKGAAGVVDDLGNQLTGLITSIPRSLDDMENSVSLLNNIAKLDEAVKNGQATADAVAAARAQQQQKFNAALSSTLTAFTTGGQSLSEAADGQRGSARKLEARAEDAHATEIANQTRATADLNSAKARLAVLDERLTKLNKAVDDKRGGPTEDLLSILPNKDELSGLMDLGAEDAAAPELAAAKKSVELALAQLEKVLKLIDKTVEFERLREIRDKVFAARNAQNAVVVAAQSALDKIKRSLGALVTVTGAKEAMTAIAEETSTLSQVLLGFAGEIRALDGQEVTGEKVTTLATKAKTYFVKVKKAYNDVILGSA